MNEITAYKSKIYLVRGQSVMLDKDLSDFYGIETGSLNRAQKRKADQFGDSVFQLTSSEWVEIRAIQGLPPLKGYLPWAYTEKASYKMAFVLDSKTSMKVADLILEVFMSVRSGDLIPAPNNNASIQLEHRIQEINKEMMGKEIVVNNYYYGPVIQGNNNQVQMGSSEDLIMNLGKLLTDTSVLQHKDLTSLLVKSLDQANKKDKKGLLETLGTVAEVGTKISSLSQSVPALILWVSKFL